MLNMAKSIRPARPPIRYVVKLAALLSLSLVLLIGLILGIIQAAGNATVRTKIPERVVGISYTATVSMDDMVQREQHEVLRTF